MGYRVVICPSLLLNRGQAEGMENIAVMKMYLRKMDDVMKMELSGWSPLAVRCSLDLIPADMVTVLATR